ncbi:hypothetical protein V6N12_017978 [Hibiscus sabdariffa]|uniref:Reverse transcriptase zinc-binding domain-containing protein n=1 Tax=Hibiscus sabdariffa TaxID=183260 RepID=A0ABR1ZSU6_9ROSI
MKAPRATPLEDFIRWECAVNHKFSVKSAYTVRQSSYVSQMANVWSIIHKFQGLPRLKVFLWLVCHDKIMTNVERVRRHIAEDSGFSICGVAVEDHGATDASHWDILFATIAWNLWLARNAKIFGITGVEDGSVIIRSRHVLQLTLHNGDKRGASRFDHSHLSSATMIWSPPSGSFIKINTDAARRTSDGFARCGGVARDCSGS